MVQSSGQAEAVLCLRGWAVTIPFCFIHIDVITKLWLVGSDYFQVMEVGRGAATRNPSISPSVTPVEAVSALVAHTIFLNTVTCSHQ